MLQQLSLMRLIKQLKDKRTKQSPNQVKKLAKEKKK
jgi:hypothetical protein